MSRIATTRIPQSFVGRGVKVWPLAIAAVRDLGRSMRRLTLEGEALASFAYEAGNDVMVPLAEDGGVTVCRRYTIRSFDLTSRRLDLDLVLHGEGIGARWAASAKAADLVEVGGPRGKVTLAKDARWHLFAGDESAIPAMLAMMEALPDGVPSRALLAIESAGDEQPHRVLAGGKVIWLPRAGGALPDALVQALQAAPLPEGPGHLYLAGEDKLVAALKQAALECGVAGEAISAKAYWSRGSRNREHGEPRPLGEGIFALRNVSRGRSPSAPGPVTALSPVLGTFLMMGATRDRIEDLREKLDRDFRAKKLSWKSAQQVWSLVAGLFHDASAAKIRDLRVREDNPAPDLDGPIER